MSALTVAESLEDALLDAVDELERLRALWHQQQIGEPSQGVINAAWVALRKAQDIPPRSEREAQK